MLRCDNCGNTNGSSREVAEFVLGWRLWSGQTFGGKWKQETLCPTCCDTAPVRAEGDPGWSAHCSTCDWDWREECYEDGPLTEQEAKRMAREHRCEPCADAYEIEPKKPAAVVTVPTLAGVL